MSTKVSFDVEIRIIDMPRLLEFGEEVLDGDVDGLSKSDIIRAAIINCERAPIDTGFEFVGDQPVREAPNGEEGRWLVGVQILVHDPEALAREAIRRRQACFFDGQSAFEAGDMPTLGHLAYEVVVASNASPSPDRVGFESVEPHFFENAPAPILEEREEPGPV